MGLYSFSCSIRKWAFSREGGGVESIHETGFQLFGRTAHNCCHLGGGGVNISKERAIRKGMGHGGSQGHSVSTEGGLF